MATQKKSNAGPLPVAWFAIVGSDGERLRSFYSRLFGWETADWTPHRMGSPAGSLQASEVPACDRIRQSRRHRGSAKECGASPRQDHGRPCRVSRQEAVGARKGPREVRVLRRPQGPCNRPPPWHRSTTRRSHGRQAGSFWRSRGLESSLPHRGGHPTRDEHQFCICSVLEQSSQMISYQSLFRRKGFRA